MDNPLDILKKSNSEIEKYLLLLSDAYYNDDKALVSDKVFDYIRDEYYKRNPTSDYFNLVGTQNVLKSVELPYKMFSLDKIKPDNGEYERWINKYKGPYILSDKLDGISALLDIKNNKRKLYLRGNAILGTDVSSIIKYININLKNCNNMAIRGELIMTKENFNKIKDNYNYQNSRMCVNGIIKRKVLNKDLLKLIDFVPYEVVYPRYKQIEQHKILDKLGGSVFYKEVDNITVDYMINYFKERRENNIYDIDGIVITDNNDIYNNKDDKNPEHKVAFKALYKEQYKITKIIDIEWNKSRLGVFKPRVKVEEVEILNSKINYATAHNARFVVDNKIGPGAVIKISKSGDIIPFILEVLVGGKVKMPDEEYEWNETEIDIIACNMDSDVDIKRLTYSMKILKVDSFGEKYIKRLVDKCGCKNIIDLINIDIEIMKDEIGDNMGVKLYNMLINRLNNCTLVELMCASNCFEKGFGLKKLNTVISLYKSNDINILEWLKSLNIDNIIEIGGFAEKSAPVFIKGIKSFIKFFDKLCNKQNVVNFDRLINMKTNIKKEVKKETIKRNKGMFNNEVITYTGFRDKDGIITKFIENEGGTISDTFNKKTSILIYADENKSSGKISKAKIWGIKIMSKEELESLIK